jgi:hypothetical protein
MAKAQEAHDGMKMFDTDMVLGTDNAKAFFNKGYRAVARYIPRITAKPTDLSLHEIEKIHLGGLAILPTQHVEAGEWTPTDDKGRQYGQVAAMYCQGLGVPSGVHVVLDLESISKSVPKEQVFRYCNLWHDIVAQAGYKPMIYLGWQVLMNNAEAYNRLKFDRYWGAYNVDVVPSPRGYCIQQHAAKAGDTIAPYEIDTDLIKKDALGGLPTLYAPDEWAA